MNSVEDAERTWTSIDEQKRKKVWVYRRSLSSKKKKKIQLSMRLVICWEVRVVSFRAFWWNRTCIEFRHNSFLLCCMRTEAQSWRHMTGTGREVADWTRNLFRKWSQATRGGFTGVTWATRNIHVSGRVRHLHVNKKASRVCSNVRNIRGLPRKYRAILNISRTNCVELM